MNADDETQARLLAGYLEALQQGPVATPPPDLDAETAATARALQARLAPPPPEPAFAGRLRARIDAEAARMATGAGHAQSSRTPAVMRPLRRAGGWWGAAAAVLVGAILLAAIAVLLVRVRGGGPAPAVQSPSPTAAPCTGAAPALDHLWIRLCPDSAAPGSTVRLEGFLPGGAPSAQGTPTAFATSHATVCFGGCDAGIKITEVPVQWSSTEPGRFTMLFSVPRLPWLAADGVHALKPGEYQLGVQIGCAGPVGKGCTGVPEATATFRLTGPTPSRCTGSACAELAVSPASASPGTTVQASGWLPLAPPYAYMLLLERPDGSDQTSLASVQPQPDGSFSATFRLPQAIASLGVLAPGRYRLVLQAGFPTDHPPATATTGPGGVTIMPLQGGKAGFVQVQLARATLTVSAARTWASLGPLDPLAQQLSGWGSPLAADPSNPGRLAYCVPGGIRLTSDGGRTWSTISTAGVRAVAARAGVSLQSPPTSGPTCSTVLLDSQHPGTLFAAFGAAPMPPVLNIAVQTTNGGQSWTAVPPPAGSQPTDFRGFRIAGKAVLALYASLSLSAGAAQLTVSRTTDGARTWNATTFPCPAAGPCLAWGPASVVTGMQATQQPIERSADGGQTWLPLDWPSPYIAKFAPPSDLVTLSASSVALLSPGQDYGQDRYPFLLSGDAGKTWQPIALPTLRNGVSSGWAFESLRLLPDGSLLGLSTADGAWDLLPPGASSWCTVMTPAPAGHLPESLTVAGGQLWWIEQSGTAAPTVRHVGLSALRCG